MAHHNNQDYSACLCLLAEDHQDTAMVYNEALQDKGHVVVHTKNGEDCLKVYHDEFQTVISHSNPGEQIQPFDAGPE